jgi:hypothetical protein
MKWIKTTAKADNCARVVGVAGDEIMEEAKREILDTKPLSKVKVFKAYVRSLIILVIIGMTLMNPNLAEVIRILIR